MRDINWQVCDVCQLPSTAGQSGIRLTPSLHASYSCGPAKGRDPPVVTPLSVKLESEGLKGVCVAPRVERGHMGVKLQLITLTIFYYARPPLASMSDTASN